MKTKKTPHQRLGGTEAGIVDLALEIERLKKADPGHYAKIMRKLAELERSNKK